MRKVYLDLGANDGSSIRQFRRSQSVFAKRSDAMSYGVIAVEPRATEFRLRQRFPSVQTIEQVAWTKGGEIAFRFDEKSSGYGSCVAGFSMIGSQAGDVVKLPCFDLAEFVHGIAADYLVVKMDIESSEYTVLPWLLDSGACGRINELYIEFHHRGSLAYDAQRIEICRRIREQAPGCYLCDEWP